MKKWTGGLVALILAASPLTLLIAVALVVALIGGLLATFSGGLAGVAGYQVNKENGQCRASNGGGSGTPTTASQEEYVRTIIGVAKAMGVSERGQIIAIMVAFQESGIRNYANTGENRYGYNAGQGTSKSTSWWMDTAKISLEYPHDAKGKDADSVGIFQQRPSAGWGDGGGYTAASSNDHGRKSVERLLDPKWSAQAFFGGKGGPANKGLTDIKGWESMPLTKAAQTVQISAFPDAYAKWEKQARALVKANSDAPKVSLSGGGGSESSGNDSESEGSGGDSSATATQMPMKEGTYRLTSGYGPRTAPTAGASTWHKGQDFGAPKGTPIYSVADGTVAAAGSAHGFGQWIVIDHELDGQKWSTVYGHVVPNSIKVSKGDKVSAGQHIAGVGSEGFSSGPHLHFEVWKGGRFSPGGGKHVEPMKWLKGNHTASTSSSTDCVNAGGDTSAGSAAEGTAKEAIEAAKTQIGVDYSWGGGSLKGPSKGFGRGAGITGFDCSSLMRYAIYQGTGKTYEIPRTSTEQWRALKKNKVSWNEMKPGDLIFYGSGDSMHHVAMFLGDGKMIEAPRTGLKVRITKARDKGFAGAARPDYKDS